MKSKIYILHTLVEKSRYLDDIPYSIWFIEDNILLYASTIFDNDQFEDLMDLTTSEKFNFLKSIIEEEREKGRLSEQEIDNIDMSTFDNEIGLKQDLLKSLRQYKLNQIIK